MRSLILAGAAALAFTTAPAMADDHMGAYDMTEAQQQKYMSWSDDQRIAYQRWPVEVQEYYWTLNADQVSSWWVLTDEQRVRIYEMTPQQRSAAWTQIAAQMADASPAATTTAKMQFVSNERVQPTPADAGPPTGDVPICSANQQDNCINAWAAGKRGPGVTKPLDYWPGEPASDM